MKLADSYSNIVCEKIQKVITDQAKQLNAAATEIFKSLTQGGVWHLFGAGHSHMAVEEAFHRAGGLVPVNPMLEEYLMPHAGPSRNGPMERLSGLAKIIFDFYKPLPGEVITIISNSGINSTSIEMAEVARANGLKIIGITNLEHSKATPSRHSSGKKLYQLCDLVIDTGGVKGDAAVTVPALDVPVGPLSTILNALTINYLAIAICELYSAEGLKAPIYLSANLPGGDDRNRNLEEKYRSRIPRLR